MLSCGQVDVDNNPTVRLVRKHLVEHLGPPQDIFEVQGSAVPGSPLGTIDIAQFAPGGPASPVVFATCGAARYRMKDGRRVEALFIAPRHPSDPDAASIRRLLAAFALFPEANDEAVRLGDVVRARDALASPSPPSPLSPLSGMDAVLCVPPLTFLPSFHRVGLHETEVVELVWLLPVYGAEADYALEHGPQALMMLFAAQSLDLTDLARSPADVSMTPARAADAAQRVVEAPPPMTTSARGANVARGGAEGPTTRRASAAVPPRGPAQASPPEPPGDTVTVQRRVPRSELGPQTRPARRPKTRPRRPGEDEEVRFDLSRDGLASGPKPARTAPRTTAAPTPPTVAEPEMSKADRVAALKKAARDARARAKARQEGRVVDAATRSPPPAAARSGRRSSPRASPSTPASSSRDSGPGTARAASRRRRGAPFRRDGE